MNLAERVAAVRARIQAACRRSGRDAGEVTVVAVTKTAGPCVLAPLLAAGIRDVGENRVLDAIEKSAGAPPGIRWHFVGHLQTNKARKALSLFRTIQSVDSLKLARVLQEEAARAGTTIEAFAEINSGEAQKTGMAADAAEEFFAEAVALDRLKWVGLMTMAPLAEVAEASRPAFRRLRELRDRLRARLPSLAGLSMGMTQDFEVAVEEGATHLRLGRVLFAEPEKNPTGPAPSAQRS